MRKGTFRQEIMKKGILEGQFGKGIIEGHFRKGRKYIMHKLEFPQDCTQKTPGTSVDVSRTPRPPRAREAQEGTEAKEADT